ncbi:hypothetical protein D3C83_168370 [compost metagenome]
MRWAAPDPVAGLAEAGRVTAVSLNRSNRSMPNIDHMYGQAPMFRGSSCTQMTGVPSA